MIGVIGVGEGKPGGKGVAMELGDWVSAGALLGDAIAVGSAIPGEVSIGVKGVSSGV
jgi:hypothetical protein